MKKFFVAAALAASLAGAAAVAGPVNAKQSIYTGWGQDELSLRENLSVSNDLNLYTVTVAQWKAKSNQAPQTQFWLFEPRDFGGFSRPIMDFVRLEVNGIREIKLQPKKEDMKPWKDGDRAGFEVTLNFDGAKVLARWFMRPDSPVLWCTLKPAEGSVEPIKDMTLWINVIPSKLAKDDKGGVIWEGGYARQAVTPARKIEQGPNPVDLADTDSYLIMQDAKFEGGSEEKGGGPSIIIPGKSDAAKGSLNLRDGWLVDVKFVFSPDFKEYTFGLWQQKNPVTNAAVAEMVSKNPEQFQVK